eukprot:476479_1
MCICYQYFKSHKRKKTKTIKTMYWIGLIYIVLSMLLFITHTGGAIHGFFDCNNKSKTGELIIIIAIILYAIQTYTLWIVLFTRIFFVFKDTVYKLSSCTKYSVIIFFVSVLVLGSIATMFDKSQSVDNLIAVFELFLSICFCTWLSCLFLYKLFKVFSNSEKGSDDVLLSIIIKQSLLAVISIGMTLFTILTFIMAAITGHAWASFVVFLCDQYTNAICVVLGYSCFDSYYKKFCFRCHNGCTKIFCCSVVVEHKKSVANIVDVASVTMSEQNSIETISNNTNTSDKQKE